MEGTKLGIIGMGAIGSVVSTLFLDSPSIEITYFSRTERDHISVHGPTVDTRKRVTILAESTIGQKFDLIVICLKLHQYPAARELIRSLANTETKFALIGNGINLGEQLATITSPESILECIIDCPVEEMAPYYYTQLRKAKISTRKGTLAEQFRGLFDPEQVDFELLDDFNTANWKKTIESAMLGGLMISINGTITDIIDKNLVGTYLAGVEESISVARATGALIPDDFPDMLLRKLFQYPSNKGSSMLTDFRKKKILEIEAKNGAISSFGKRLGIPTPINDELIAMMRRKQAEYGTEK